MMFDVVNFGSLFSGENEVAKYMKADKSFVFSVGSTDWVVTPTLVNPNESLSCESTKLQLVFEKRRLRQPPLFPKKNSIGAYIDRTDEILRRMHDLQETKKALSALRAAVDAGEYDDEENNDANLVSEITHFVGIIATHSRAIKALDTGTNKYEKNAFEIEKKFQIAMTHGLTYSIGLYFEEEVSEDVFLQWRRPVTPTDATTMHHVPKNTVATTIFPLKQQLVFEIDNGGPDHKIPYKTCIFNKMSKTTISCNTNVVVAVGGDTRFAFIKKAFDLPWEPMQRAAHPSTNPLLLVNPESLYKIDVDHIEKYNFATSHWCDIPKPNCEHLCFTLLCPWQPKKHDLFYINQTNKNIWFFNENTKKWTYMNTCSSDVDARNWHQDAVCSMNERVYIFDDMEEQLICIDSSKNWEKTVVLLRDNQTDPEILQNARKLFVMHKFLFLRCYNFSRNEHYFAWYDNKSQRFFKID